MPAHYSQPALKFLIGLKKNNDREWFDARKSTYETELKVPTLAIIEEINHAIAPFAPEFIRPPQKIMMRIYRDIRFAADKRPYKTHISAWWSRQGLEKTSGGGFYLDLNPTELKIAAGVYMPEKEQLLAIRRMLLERHAEYRAIIGSKKLTALLQPIDGMKMTRGPKGFPADNPAMDLVLQRQWGVWSTLPSDIALGPALVKEVVKRFRLASPLIALLNEPLVKRPLKPLF
jgi:uncharacterized protein (TIGR02453 family)